MGWVRGALPLAAGRSLLDGLNAHQGLLVLRGAVLPGGRERLETFALRVASISLVLAVDQDAGVRARQAEGRGRLGQPSRPRRVMLALDRVHVSGIVDLSGRARLADVFASGRSFARIDAASLEVGRGAGGTEQVESFPEVYVNVARAHGFTEFEDEAPALAPSIVPAHPDTLAALGLPVVPGLDAADPGAADRRSSAAARTSGGLQPAPLRPGLSGGDGAERVRPSPFRR